MPPYWLRLAFVAEFLLALVAILEVWSEVGGQNHLDLMAVVRQAVASRSDWRW